MPRVAVLSALVVLAAACTTTDPDSERRRFGLCLGTDLDSAQVQEGFADIWTLEGTIVEERAFQEGDCGAAGWMEGARTLVIQSEEAQMRIGYGMGIEQTTEWAPVVHQAVGTEVSATVFRVNGWAIDLGAVVEADDGILLAGYEGWNGGFASLGAANPLTSLEVTAGELSGPTQRDGCGRTQGQELRFDFEGVPEGPLTVDSGGEAFVGLGDHELYVQNVGAWSYVGQVECTDTWGPAPWLVTRMDPADRGV